MTGCAATGGLCLRSFVAPSAHAELAVCSSTTPFLCMHQRYGTSAVNACFDAWGGEPRCLLRVLRGNFHVVDDAMKQ